MRVAIKVCTLAAVLLLAGCHESLRYDYGGGYWVHAGARYDHGGSRDGLRIDDGCGERRGHPRRGHRHRGHPHDGRRGHR